VELTLGIYVIFPFSTILLSETYRNPQKDTFFLAHFIERIENGEEELVGPFTTKEDLWRSLGI